MPNVTAGYCVATIFIIVLVISYGSALCYQDRGAFNNMCTSQYNGVVIGSQCYFYVANLSTWEDSWASCQSQGGATLANIQTKLEMDRIDDYLVNQHREAQFPWVALCSYGDSPDNYAMTLNSTFWHDSPTAYRSMLTAGNSWVRSHQEDDPDPKTDACFKLWGNRFDMITGASCGTKRDSLCQITNTYQTFVKVHDVCLTEQPIESYSSLPIENCATNCAAMAWCRSFNYFRNRDCQLFGWSVNDNPAKTINNQCYHYTYVI